MSVDVTIPLAGGEGDHQAGQTDDYGTRRRICTSCGSSKRFVDFAIDRTVADGRRSVCASCRAAYDHDRYLHRTPGEIDYKRRARDYGNAVVLESFQRQDMIDRYGDACVYCGGFFEVTDHILCVAAGGSHTLENVVPSCTDCNVRKYWNIDRHLIKIVRTAYLFRTVGSDAGA